MNFVNLQPVGKNLEADTTAMRRLCIDSMSDEWVMREFEPTIEFFTQNSQDDCESRISQRFVEDKVSIGNIILFNGVECGFVAAGHSDLPMPDESVVEGVNLSLWITDGYRGIGIGKYAALQTLSTAAKEINSNPAWRNRIIWTAIAKDNIASQNLFIGSGFVKSHLLAGIKDDKYSAYVLAKSTDGQLALDFDSPRTPHESNGQ